MAERCCSQCGAEMKIREWDGRRRPVCPACDWIYYAQRKVCVAALVLQDGDVLLLRRARPPYAGAWGLPAGYAEIDETPVQAVAREVAEETGLQVAVGPLFGAYPFDDDPRGPGILLTYLARPIGGSLRAADEGPAQWTPVAELPSDLVGAGQSDALLAWQRAAQAGSETVRHCARCGAPIETREAFGRPRPVCPACSLVHFREPKTAAGVLIEQDGRVLLGLRGVSPGRGLWYLPSGYVDWDERVDLAAIREMEEETGLIVAITGLFGVFPFGDEQNGFGAFILYRGRVTGGALQAADDVVELGFFGADDLPPLAFETTQQALEQWRAERDRA